MRRISWYLRRLRVMSAAEVLHRVSQQFTLLWLHAQFRFSFGIAGPGIAARGLSFCSGTEARLPHLPVDLSALGQKAPALLAGQVPVAGKTWWWDGGEETWHRAPDTGRIWTRDFFGNIDYREGNPTGDVRELWEPARLQQLFDLALVAQTGKEGEREQSATLATAQLVSWVKANPPLAGPHYISAMECALRVIAVCHALDLLRPQIRDEAPWTALAAIVSSHAPLLERRLSLHSSTGNHTVAEASGLVYVGLLFPEMDDAHRWLQRGLAILSETAHSQVLPDGGGVEQALWYHYFNVQLLLLVMQVVQHYGVAVPENISAAADRGTRFLAAMGLSAGRIPPIGDADGGYALSSLLQLPDCSGVTGPDIRSFRDSGYTVAQIGTSASLVIDHGPLGMPPSYGHGHADALSVLLRVDGEDLLLDPGTYTYTGDQAWRRYFKSTPAHNTVTVERRDQATQDACFLWSRPFHARLIDADVDGNGGRLIAEHDGYLDAGVLHTRGIAWRRDRWLVVLDNLSGEGTHFLELHWHLGRDPDPLGPDGLKVSTAGGGTLAMRFGGGSFSTLKGQKTPISGWRSPSYGRIEPVTTVKVSARNRLPHGFTTFITLPGGRLEEADIEDALQWIKDRAS